MRIEGPTLKPSAVMAAIEAFIELIAAGDCDRVSDFCGPGWTPDLVERTIDDYRTGARVTARGVTRDMGFNRVVLAFRNDSTGFDGEVVIDLFLDGESTDLSAIFSVRSEHGSWVVELTSVRVM